MFNVPLKLVLLIAIATSQIFGGVSCCCFARSELAFSSSHSVGKTSNTSPEPQAQHPVKCSKCATRNTKLQSDSSLANTTTFNHSNLDQDDQCLCTRVSFNAYNSESYPSVESHLTYLSCESTTEPRASESVNSARKHEVPLQTNHHSWQSIACIWTI
jgi:hypothetical protein